MTNFIDFEIAISIPVGLWDDNWLKTRNWRGALQHFITNTLILSPDWQICIWPAF
jgi:hypothetical protein